MKFLRNRRNNMNKFIGCLVLYALTTMSAFAQSSTNSPYSQFGLGDLADEGVGFNKGMGGVGYGFRKGNEVNPLNPASYSAIDSVTMIFDGGLSGQITNFKEGGRKLNAKSGGFDYIMGALRLFPRVGLTFGRRWSQPTLLGRWLPVDEVSLRRIQCGLSLGRFQPGGDHGGLYRYQLPRQDV